MKRLLILLVLFLPGLARAEPMNVVGCSIFDAKGRLAKKYYGWICAFLPNGKMMVGDGFTLTFYDEKMNVVWSRDGHTHHNMIFSETDQTVLVTGSRTIRDSTARLDTLEVFDLEGARTKSFSFTPEMSLGERPFHWDQQALPATKTELTQIASFYRIPPNGSKEPALAEGNYVAWDNFGRVYFLDSGLKKVVRAIEPKDWPFPLASDLQVTEEGRLLFYQMSYPARGLPAMVAEAGFHERKIVWAYRGDPGEKLEGDFEGNVQRLPGGNFLFSEVGKFGRSTAEFRAREITREGKVVWRMKASGRELSGMPNTIKRYDLAAYRRAKGRL